MKNAQGMLGFGLGMVFGAMLGMSIDIRSPFAALSEVSVADVSVSERVPDLSGDEDSVLVIDVKDPARAAAVRASIGDDRVVAESPHGFALRERRLVVSSIEEAGTLLFLAGWEDAGLQILRFDPVPRQGAPQRGGDARARGLADLMKQDHLTYYEAQQALALL